MGVITKDLQIAYLDAVKGKVKNKNWVTPIIE